MKQIIAPHPRFAVRHAIGVAAAVVLVSSTPVMAQFYATQNSSGDTVVVDQNGLQVEVTQSDPVGSRPDYCPIGAYYVSEVQADKTELVLTDCAMGSQQYTVQMAAPPSTPSE